MIGKTDQANHQYDLADFWNTVNISNIPDVSFLKGAKYQDGHAGYSDLLETSLRAGRCMLNMAGVRLRRRLSASKS
jgi:hypothetical protein